MAGIATRAHERRFVKSTVPSMLVDDAAGAGVVMVSRAVPAATVRSAARRTCWKDELLRRLVSPYLDDLGAVLLELEETTGPIELHGLLRELVVTRIWHADAVGLLDDPAVRRNGRLATRIREVHERSVMCLLRAAGLPGAERVRAVAALGVLEALTDLPAPDRPASDHMAALAAEPLEPSPSDPRP